MHKDAEFWRKLTETPDKQQGANQAMIHLLDKLKMDHHELYEQAEEELYIIAFGEHMNEAIAMKAVDGMRNTDGSNGGYWPPEQADAVARQLGILYDKFTMWDWYYVLNMMYSDYGTIQGVDAAMCARLAMAWLDDPDVAPGKAYRYYKYVVKEVDNTGRM